ncbi:MAG: hypothetical protein ACI4ON_00460 [Clostridia bacterium]
MGIIETMILIIMCILKIAIMNLPTLLIIIGIQAVTYWITGISIYNNIMKFVLRRI